MMLRKLFIFLILIFYYFDCKLQTDFEIALKKNYIKYEFEATRKVEYMFKDNNIFIKYNPISLIFGGLMYFYQNNISILTGSVCPFEYHCSMFSIMCIKKYGLLYGISLTADRLTRCTRLASYDLIPGIDYDINTLKVYDNPNDYTFKKFK